MRRDRISNEKVIDFFPPAARGSGSTYYSGVFDTMRVSTSRNTRECLTNLMLMVSVGTGWAAGGQLSIIMQHGLTGNPTALVNYAQVALMQADEGEDLYLAEIKDFNRFVRLSLTVIAFNATVCVLGSGNRSRREPVTQVGSEKAVTYLSDPITA